MSRLFRMPNSRSLLLLLLGLGLTACNGFAATVRQLTYPPDFVYVSSEELRSNMDQLAYRMAQLDEALIDDNFQQPNQSRVLSVLRQIEQIGSRLQASEAGASHPFLEDDMPGFVNTVTRARIAASLDPPRYYWAGRVTGACMNCHKRNR